MFFRWFTGSQRFQVMTMRLSMDTVGAGKWWIDRTAIGKEQTERHTHTLAQPKQKESQIRIAIEHNLRPEHSNLSGHRRKGAPLFDDIAVAPSENAQHFSQRSCSGQIPNRVFV